MEGRQRQFLEALRRFSDAVEVGQGGCTDHEQRRAHRVASPVGQDAWLIWMRAARIAFGRLLGQGCGWLSSSGDDFVHVHIHLREGEVNAALAEAMDDLGVQVIRGAQASADITDEAA